MRKIRQKAKSLFLVPIRVIFCPINPSFYKAVLKIYSSLILIPFVLFSVQPQILLADIINDISADQTFSTSTSDDGTMQRITAGDGTHFSSSDYDIPLGSSVQIGCTGACSWNVTESTSEILGHWLTEGNWTFINPFGIHIGEAAQVDVSGSLVLSTLNLSTGIDLANQMVFEKIDGFPNASILNEGIIKVDAGGKIALLSERIENRGTIQATLGQAVLAAGEKITLSFDSEGWISLVVDRGLSALSKNTDGSSIPAIANFGTIEANGGRIELSVKTLNDTLDLLINNEGIIEAQEAVVTKDGAVTFVDGSVNLFSNGAIHNQGIIRTNVLHEHGFTFENTGTLLGGQKTGEVYFDNIDGAANISGNIGANISDTGNLNVTGNITLLNDVTLTADSDNSAGGDFVQQAGTSVNGGGKNLTIRSGPSPTTGTGNVQYGSISNVNSLIITAGGGNIIRAFGSVAAHNVSFAAGGNVALAGSITADTGDVSIVADSDGNGSGAISFANGTVIEAPNTIGCSCDPDGDITLKGSNSFTYGAAGANTISSNGGATNATLNHFHNLNVQTTGSGNDITLTDGSFSAGCTGYSFQSSDDIIANTNISVSNGSLTLTAAGQISALNNMNQSGGTVTVNGTMDLNGSYNQTGGIFNAPAVLKVGNDFTQTAVVFNHRNGKVIFDSPTVADINVNGSINFWDFESTQAGKTLRFGAGDTFNVLSNWTITGTIGTPIQLERLGGVGLDQWNINATNPTVSGVIVSNSNNIGGSPVMPLDSVNGGNNTAWVFSSAPAPVPGPNVSPTVDPVNAQLTPKPAQGLEGVDFEPGAAAAVEEAARSKSVLKESTGPQNVYVANLDGLQVFNANAAEPIKTFQWNEAPVSIRSSENGDHIYALLQKAKELLVIDGTSLEVKQKIEGLAEESTDLAVSPNEDIAYVPSAAIDRVQVIDLQAGSITKTFATGSMPSQIVLTGDGKYLFVSNQLDKTISKIHTGSGLQEAVFGAGESPFGMVLLHDDQDLFVTDSGSNSVLMIGTGIPAPKMEREDMTGTIEQINQTPPAIQTDVTTPESGTQEKTQSADLSPQGTAEEANREAEKGVNRLSGKENPPILMPDESFTYQVKAKIAVGNSPYFIQADREGKKLFVSNRASNSISIIDVEKRSLIGEISVGKRPSGIAIEPEGKRLFVANELSGSVSSIDLSNGEIIANIPAGIVPTRVLFNTPQKS